MRVVSSKENSFEMKKGGVRAATKNMIKMKKKNEDDGGNSNALLWQRVIVFESHDALILPTTVYYYYNYYPLCYSLPSTTYSTHSSSSRAQPKMENVSSRIQISFFLACIFSDIIHSHLSHSLPRRYIFILGVCTYTCMWFTENWWAPVQAPNACFCIVARMLFV